MANDPGLNQLLIRLVGDLPRPEANASDAESKRHLHDLASRPDWSESEIRSLDMLSNRVEIKKSLFHADPRRTDQSSNKNAVDVVWHEITVAIFLKAVLIRSFSANAGIALKRFNVLFKSLDIARPDWLGVGTLLGEAMDEAWTEMLANLPLQPRGAEIAGVPDTLQRTEIQEIPLTVLFYEGPIGRAYLETMLALGYRPSKILHLASKRNLVTGREVGKWLPDGLRRPYAASAQYRQIHHWAMQLEKSYPDIVARIQSEVQEKYGFASASLAGAQINKPLTSYATNVQSLLIDNLKDGGLRESLLEQPSGAILFTGGGIMPADLLDIAHIEYLHIHPGFLPDIRGADGMLWSTLLTGHPSASCFYMATGIDTGDIVHASWLPRLQLPLERNSIDTTTAYRLIYAFADPWIRAFVLRDVLIGHASFDNRAARAQATDEGVTYHFMHERLKEAAIRILVS